MSDNKEVYCKIIKGKSIHYPVLVPNKKGMESALECGVKEIALFTAASESFTKKNINCSIVSVLIINLIPIIIIIISFIACFIRMNLSLSLRRLLN